MCHFNHAEGTKAFHYLSDKIAEADIGEIEPDGFQKFILNYICTITCYQYLDRVPLQVCPSWRQRL